MDRGWIRTDCANRRLVHALSLEPAQAFEEQTLPESFALKIGVRAYRLKVTELGLFIRPNDAERSRAFIWRNDKDLVFRLIHG